MKRVVSILALFLFTLILNIRTDGFFPLSPATDPILLYATSLLVVLSAFLVLFVVLRPKRFKLDLKSFQTQRNLRILLFLTTATNFLIYTVLTIRNFNNFAGLSSLTQMVLFSTLTILLVVILFAYRSSDFRLILGATLSSFVVLSLLQINYFPITSHQADLMPIIIAQGEAFLKGENIYQFYLLDNGIWTQAVRQPGNVLFYLPAVFFSFDPRVLSVLYLLATAFILFKIAYPSLTNIKVDKKFLLTTLLISLFLFFPYRLVRSELYEPPFWLLFALSVLFIKEKQHMLSSVVWGVGIFTQVWFWLFTPFYFVFLLRRLGIKRSFRFALVTLATAATLLLPFILRAPADYYYHVFGYYQGVVKDGVVYLNNYYLTPIFQALDLRALLQLVQFGAVAVIGMVSLKYMKTFKNFLAFLTIAFLVFIQFNSLTWNYFYINFVFFLIIYLIPSTQEGVENGKP